MIYNIPILSVFVVIIINIIFLNNIQHVNSHLLRQQNVDDESSENVPATSTINTKDGSGTISSGPATDGPILSNAKPIAGGRGNFMPAVTFEDTAYSNDYWSGNDRLMEYKDKINEKVIRPEVVINNDNKPKNPNLQANIAAQKAVKAVPATPVVKKIPTPKPAVPTTTTPKKKEEEPKVNNPAEAAMKNTAQEITKQMDNFEKKVAKENAASLEKIPDNVKKAIGKNKQQEKAAKEIGQAMAQGGASAADNVKKINEASNNPGRR